MTILYVLKPVNKAEENYLHHAGDGLPSLAAASVPALSSPPRQRLSSLSRGPSEPGALNETILSIFSVILTIGERRSDLSVLNLNKHLAEYP
jgi:hypothetical protein